MVQEEAEDLRRMQLNIGARGSPCGSWAQETASHSLLNRCILQEPTESTSLDASCKSHFLHTQASCSHTVSDTNQFTKRHQKLTSQTSKMREHLRVPCQSTTAPLSQSSSGSRPCLLQMSKQKTLTEACKQGA